MVNSEVIVLLKALSGQATEIKQKVQRLDEVDYRLISNPFVRKKIGEDVQKIKSNKKLIDEYSEFIVETCNHYISKPEENISKEKLAEVKRIWRSLVKLIREDIDMEEDIEENLTPVQPEDPNEYAKKIDKWFADNANEENPNVEEIYHTLDKILHLGMFETVKEKVNNMRVHIVRNIDVSNHTIPKTTVKPLEDMWKSIKSELKL